MPKSSILAKTINYLDWVNSLVANNIAKPQELMHAENWRSPKIGTIETREWIQKVWTASGGGEFVATWNYWLFYFDNEGSDNSGMYRISAVNVSPSVANIYYLNNEWEWIIVPSNWSGIKISAWNQFDYTIADWNLYLVNYIDDNRSISDVDWVSVSTSQDMTGNLFRSPKAAKINYYKNRLYVANYISNDWLVKYPTTILRSSTPLGIVSLVEGDPDTPFTTIPVTDTTYIYSNKWAELKTWLDYSEWTSVFVSDTGIELYATSDHDYWDGTGWQSIWYIYKSTDRGTTWTKITSIAWTHLWWWICGATDISILFAWERNWYIYKSTDHGATWTQITSLGSKNWISVSSNNYWIVIAADWVNRWLLYVSHDYGVNWVNSQASISGRSWVKVAVSKNQPYACAFADSDYVYTTNNAWDVSPTWTSQTWSWQKSWRSWAISSDWSVMYWLVYNDFIYKSTDHGVTWNTLVSPKKEWKYIVCNQDWSIVYCSNTANWFIDYSVDSWLTWFSDKVEENNKPINAIWINGDWEFIYSASEAWYIYYRNTRQSEKLEIYRWYNKVATVSVVWCSSDSISVLQPTFEAWYSSIQSSDELWVYWTYSWKKQFRWAANPASSGISVKEYDTFKLTSDDGSGITMLTNIWNVMMIANKSSIATWNDYTMTNFDTEIWCVSDKWYTKALGSLYFIHYTGIYATTGGMPQLISSKVEQYIQGATKNWLDNACAGRKGKSILFWIGDVNLYKDDGALKKLLKDVVLEYSITQENWFVHTGIKATEFSRYVDNNDPDRLLFTSTETNNPVCAIFEWNNDLGREIPFRCDLSPILLPSSMENIAYPQKIFIETQRGTSSNCFISLDWWEYYQLPGEIKKWLSNLPVVWKSNFQNSGEDTFPRCRRIWISIRGNSKQKITLSMIGIKYSESPEEPQYKENE